MLCKHSVETDTFLLSFTGQVQRRNLLNWPYNFDDNPSSSHDFLGKKKVLPVDLVGFWQVIHLDIGLQQV